MDDLISHRLGTVRLEPHEPVIAGSVGQWTLIYTVGSYGVDEGGTLKLAQRFASDWQVPQFDRPAEPGYTTVTTNGQAKLRPYYHTKAHERPWMKCLVIDVYDGSLAPGDTVTIILGNQSQGSPGIRAQTFQEAAHEFRLLVDPTNASVARRLPTSPLFPVLPDSPTELVCILPTQVEVGQSVEMFVKGQDRWGNPTLTPEDTAFTWQGEGQAGIDGDRLVIHNPGTGYIQVKATVETATLVCHSNPITAHDTRPAMKRFWGDLHAQTDATVGTGSEEEYFTFGRDVARLDFASHQGNDFQITDEGWQHLNEVVRAFHQDGEFVVFPGYEWSANTTAGGDRNVFYLKEGQPIFRSSHWQVPHVLEDQNSPAHPASTLFERIRQYVDPNEVLLGAHVGGRYADINSYFDQELGPLVEVVSCWGIFEWLLWDAFDKGYIVGVMGNSDGHKGRPGAEGPGAGEFGISNGLTCVLAETLTRKAVFRALKQRRCYGTSGPRIDLAFDVNGQPMGAVIEASGSLTARASVKGTAPIESLILYRGKESYKTVQAAQFSACDDSPRLRVSWRGSRIRGRGRRVTWDGAIRLTEARIQSARTFAFDAATDGILSQTERELTFASSTTGDTDGIDLMLENADQGNLIFDSQAGHCEINLAGLRGDARKQALAYGGVDMAVCLERYPQHLTEMTASLEIEIESLPGQTTPYFVKVIQEDGHMAWSSPVYVVG